MRRPSSTQLLFAIAAFVAMNANAEPMTRLALVGGMLLDGRGGEPVHHAAIFIVNNHIIAAGAASEISIPAGTPIIDTRGKTMMPGMIELHAHLALVGHGDIAAWFKWLEAHHAKYPLERVMELSAR